MNEFRFARLKMRHKKMTDIFKCLPFYNLTLDKSIKYQD